MKSQITVSIFALVMALFLGFASTPAFAAEVNKGDVTYEADTDRVARDQAGGSKTLNATSLTPGVECPDGSCYKKSPGDAGYEGQATIEPAGKPEIDPATGKVRTTK